MTITIEKTIPARTLTTPQAAVYIGMSKSFLEHSRTDGRRETHTPGPKFLRIGRAVRYLRDDLDAWLMEHRCLDHFGL